MFGCAGPAHSGTSDCLDKHLREPPTPNYVDEPQDGRPTRQACKSKQRRLRDVPGAHEQVGRCVVQRMPADR